MTTVKALLKTAGPALVFAVTVLFFSFVGVASANGPWWHLQSGSRPSYLAPEAKGQVVVTASNLGDAGTSGEVTVADTLPAGLKPLSVEGKVYEGGGGVSSRQAPVACVQPAGPCTFSGALIPFASIELRFTVRAKPVGEVALCEPNAAACERNVVTVSGGEAPGAELSRPVTVSEAPAAFGVEEYDVTPEEEGGAPATQAGKHPFQVTGTLTLNQGPSKISGAYEVFPVALAKDLAGLLPPGLIGNPTPFAKCSLAQFPNTCPAQSVLGVAMVSYDVPGQGGLQMASAPVDNLQPAHGEAARFGFEVAGQQIFIDARVRSGADYGVTLGSTDVGQAVAFLGYKLTFWGVPGSPAHDTTRGLGCIGEAEGLSSREIREKGLAPCSPLEDQSPPPFLALPTSCTGPLHTSAEADSWNEPKPEGHRSLFAETAPMIALDGCNQLPFEPQIRITPDGGEGGTPGSSPTGLNADVHVPQESILNAGSLAQSDVKDITVALPAGVALNPAGAGGLGACSGDPADLPARALGSPGDQIGYEGERSFETSPSSSTPAFSPKLPGSFDAGEALEPGVNFCSSAAKIGTVTIRSPLLPPTQPLTGSVYLADQEANPFGSLVAMYIVAEDPESGSLVKLPGEVQLCAGAGETIAGEICQAPGQIVTTFANNPQLAFEDAELHFFGGERAPLASPARCGAYTTQASFVPWSAEAWDQAARTVTASSTFDVTSGPHGGPCPGQSLPFGPSATGGATNLQAGEFSPFTATFSRQDGEQSLQSIVAKLPPGLSGVLSGVELCPEPQANQGLCGPNSLIGETTVSVGVGGDPYSVTGGKFYLTGPYNGTGGCTVGQAGCAPFGLSFVVPAKAGPFDLAKTANNHPPCDCVLVRGKIELNSVTAALTITSNPPGSPDAIPTSIEGIPLQIQRVNATTTRSNFQFNPTNCAKMAFSGTIASSEGASDAVTVPFQVTNCAALKFEPKFSVSTSGKTSKSMGASLTAKVSYPNVPQGTDADIAKVKVELPKQLPSRLTTLQKACTNAQFEASPAACPAESKIGYAVVHTPLIPVPLEGPAIFVSHGGEAFPSLTMVLQGYGITIDLVGTTFISKSGVTSTTFKAVPDQPFSSFELTLPEGPYSALAANGSLCAPTTTKTVSKKVTVTVHGHKKTETRKVKETVATSLAMPTEFVAQNGAEIHQSTAISVSGCPKTHNHSKKKKHHKAAKRRKK